MGARIESYSSALSGVAPSPPYGGQRREGEKPPLFVEVFYLPGKSFYRAVAAFWVLRLMKWALSMEAYIKM